MFRSRMFGVVVVGAWVMTACGSSGSSATDAAKSDASNAKPAVTPQSQTPQAAQAASSDSGKEITLADIFPPARERDLVLNTCGSCHAVACAATGRRTVDRWADLKRGHKDTVSGVSDADYDAMFAYLSANFNDAKPEPRVPAKFLEQGCTPF